MIVVCIQLHSKKIDPVSRHEERKYQALKFLTRSAHGRECIRKITAF